MQNYFLYILLGIQAIQTIQAQSKYFEKTYIWGYAHGAHHIFSNNEGSYDVFGSSIETLNPEYITKGFMLRINQWGDTLMLKEYTSSFTQLTVWDAIKTQFGYALATCMSQYDGDNGCKAGLLLLNSNGDVLYSGYAGTQPLLESRARSILQTPDGGYILAGLITPTTGSLNKLYIVKLKADGSTEWEKMYDYFPYYNMFMDILPAYNGGYYALGTVGRWQVALPFGGWQYMGDILIYKIDDIGNIEWEKIYFVDEEDEVPISFCQFEDGQIFLAGARNLYNELVMKLDTSFNIVWSSFAGVDAGQPSHITPTSDGNLLISGVSVLGSTNGYVKKISPTGNLLWKRIYGDAGHDYFYTHLILPDGSILLGGRNDMSSSAAVYIVKTNCMGLVTPLPQASFSWQANELNPLALQFTNLSQYVYADSIDGGKYIWDWGDGSPPVTFPSEAFQEVFHYYPATGTYTVTLSAIVCQDTSIIQATIETQSGTGGTVGILPPDPITPLPPKGGNTILVYPNPAQNTLTFALNNVLKSPLGDLGVSLLTLTGQTVLQTTLAAGETSKTISVAQLPVGIYLCRWQQAAGGASGYIKVVVVR